MALADGICERLADDDLLDVSPVGTNLSVRLGGWAIRRWQSISTRRTIIYPGFLYLLLRVIGDLLAITSDNQTSLELGYRQ